DYIKLPQEEKKQLRINKIAEKSQEIWEKYFSKNNAGEAPRPNTARGKRSLVAASQIGLVLADQGYRWKAKLKSIVRIAPQQSETIVESITTYTDNWDFDGNVWQTPSGSETVIATEFFPDPDFLEARLQSLQQRSELRFEMSEANLWIAAGVALVAVAIGRFFVSLYQTKDVRDALEDAAAVFFPLLAVIVVPAVLLFWPVVIGLAIFGIVWFLGSGFKDFSGFSGWWVVGSAVALGAVAGGVKSLVDYIKLPPETKKELRFSRQVWRLINAHTQISRKNLNAQLNDTRLEPSIGLMRKLAKVMRERDARSWRKELNRLLKSIPVEKGIAFRAEPIYEEQLYSYEYGNAYVQVGTELVRDHIDIYPNPDELQKHLDGQAVLSEDDGEQIVSKRSEIRRVSDLKLSDVRMLAPQFEKPSRDEILKVLLMMTAGVIPLGYRSLTLARKMGAQIRFNRVLPSPLQYFQRNLRRGEASLGFARQNRNLVVQTDAKNFSREQDLLVLLSASQMGSLGRTVFVLRDTDSSTIKKSQRDMHASLKRYGLEKFTHRFSVVSQFESVFINADLKTVWVGNPLELPVSAMRKKNMRFASSQQLSGPANLLVVGQYLNSGAWDEKSTPQIVEIAQQMGLLDSLKELLQAALASAQSYAKSA
ncbi:MAG TPA: hypothetical protein DIS66_01075, partial [Candidatus Omnitrophica bacterium]|nr:hypothetical protein [Candidatus Omnitrophota bacterium]